MCLDNIILIKDEMKLKLIDFGFARKEARRMSPRLAMSWYLAPEVIILFKILLILYLIFSFLSSLTFYNLLYYKG